MQKPDNSVVLYQDENGITNVRVLFADEDLWLTQNQIAEIYDTTQQNIDQHIRNIYNDKELSSESTYKKFLLVQTEGSRQVKRNISHYNLDIEKAEKEFAIYRAREMKQLESDFDRAIKALAKSKDPLQKEKGDHAEL